MHRANTQSSSFSNKLQNFLHWEPAAGMLLIASAVLAMVAANSPAGVYYDMLLSTPVVVQIGELLIAKPLLLWINDGLMVMFFFLVGLELKRELVEGELSDKRNVVLPAAGAVGGMVVPAAIYVFFNLHEPAALAGWAIPAATDIAFALGVLSLLGTRVPVALKIFLTSLAIFDDIGAIIVIALFYTSKISTTALIVVALCLPLLFWLNRSKVYSHGPYYVIGLIMWTAMLKSGVHATLTGVILALFIPLKARAEDNYSPLRKIEHDIHGLVYFFVLPVFAFANAGVVFKGMTAEQLTHGVPMGIAAGLFVGKQLGIFVLCGLCIKLGWLKRPAGMSWLSLYGTATLCGIGFTMSLFIGGLAFENLPAGEIYNERMGILLGSLLSGVVGYLILRYSLPASSVESTSAMADNSRS
ncbi:Na+/H+ antiporter NhaA [Halioxenophilus aromaticivorans]|uniref:Na(+)/H(+) antiporter NhaA n=1 Tax=Halioxenophilus aromaticivorans TaxID=1306992 RepID=A0AAV3U580_9ALTE